MDDRIRALRRLFGLATIAVILALAVAGAFTDATVTNDRLWLLVVTAGGLLGIDFGRSLLGGGFNIAVSRTDDEEE